MQERLRAVEVTSIFGGLECPEFNHVDAIVRVKCRLLVD